jgi:hypothetical protein
MSARLRITSAFRWCGAAALVFAVHAAQPADVFASCGDWLAGHGYESAGTRASRMAGANSAPADARQAAGFETPASPLDSPLPCQGPACRQAPEAPAPSAPPTLTDAQDRWLTLAGTAAMQPAGSRRVAVEQSHDLPAGQRPRVDRPPRA